MPTRHGITLGSLAYISPEQAAAQPADHRSDFYSLGASLYHLVTGRLPFEGKLQEMLVKHIGQQSVENKPLAGLNKKRRASFCQSIFPQGERCRPPSNSSIARMWFYCSIAYYDHRHDNNKAFGIGTIFSVGLHQNRKLQG